MGTLLFIIWVGSAFLYILLNLYYGITRAKSSIQWVKGVNLGTKKSLNEVYELLINLQHPAKKTVEYIADEKISVKTDIYDFEVELKEDETGNTIIQFLRNKLIFRKSKRKRVLLQWDELHYFLKASIGEIDVKGAQKIYDNNIKIRKILNILGFLIIISMIIIFIAGILEIRL